MRSVIYVFVNALRRPFDDEAIVINLISVVLQNEIVALSGSSFSFSSDACDMLPYELCLQCCLKLDQLFRSSCCRCTVASMASEHWRG